MARAKLTASTPTPPVPTADAPGRRKELTLRLNPDAWRELKILAIEQETTSHALLLKAVNQLLVKHGKPPVA